MTRQIGPQGNLVASNFIVAPLASEGHFTTIQEAINAATGPATILLKPGTYTENITLKDAVNLVAFDADSITPTVVINGTCSFSAAGNLTLSGICLQTNGSFALEVTGSADSGVILTNCYINCLNNTGISYTSSGANSYVQFFYCQGNIATTGITIFSSSGAGILQFQYCDINNGGNSTTNNTLSAGILFAQYTVFNSPITSSGTGLLLAEYSSFFGDTTTAVTINGGSSLHQLYHCYIPNISGSCISIGTGASAVVANCVLITSATNTITGAGSVVYDNITFYDSKIINTTTQNAVNSASFTPVLNFGGAATGITYSQQHGTYYRSGNTCHFSIELVLTSKGSATGVATISGMPFAAVVAGGGTVSFSSVCLTATVLTATYFFSDLSNGQTALSLFFGAASTGGSTQLADTDFSNTTTFRVQGFYFI